MTARNVRGELMVSENREELVGFFDAVDRAMPPEYADYWDSEHGSKPSSLLYADDLIRMRGLLVTQAAELEVASVLIPPSRRAGFWACLTHGRPGRTWPTYGRSRLRDHVPGSLQQGRRSDKPAVGHTKWLVAALAIRRSQCHATPGHVTSQRKLGPTVNSVMGKLN